MYSLDIKLISNIHDGIILNDFQSLQKYSIDNSLFGYSQHKLEETFC